MAEKLYTPNKIFKNTKWLSLQTRQDYLEHFQDMSASCNIINNYKKAKNYYQFLANTTYKNVSAELFGEKNHIDFGLAIDGYIQQIRDSKLLDGYKNSNKNSSVINLQQGEELLNKWEALLDLANRQQWKNIEQELQNIKNYAQNLQKALDEKSEINLSNIVGAKQDTSYSAASTIEGTLSRIQGQVLEQEAIKFINKILPEKIAQTGDITLDGKSIKSDLIVLDIENVNGEVIFKVQNGELYSTTTNSKVVNLSITELKFLNEHTVGFSAKTSKGQINFHSSYSINQLLLDALDIRGKKAPIYQLYHFYQIGLTGVNNKHVDPYQRYAISKLITQIIGENNAYLITSKGIEPTYVYIDKIINTGLSFENKKLPEHATGSYNSDFGTTNIIGPKS